MRLARSATSAPFEGAAAALRFRCSPSRATEREDGEEATSRRLGEVLPDAGAVPPALPRAG